MRRIVVATIFVLCVAIIAVMALRIDQQSRRIAVLEKQKAVLGQRVARWEDIAMRFERLNRECLQITFGGGGMR